MRSPLLLAFAISLSVPLVGAHARADDVLRVLEVRLDRPTLHALGVQLLVSDDDDFDAEVTVRVREVGGAFRDATPLVRVRPDAVVESVRASVPAQFAGSVFDLRPDTAYEIELQARDADAPSTRSGC